MDVCEDTGLLDSGIIPERPHLEVITFVLPEGVLSPVCRDYMVHHIQETQTQQERSPPRKVRILSMLEFMADPQYRSVMTREQEQEWRVRSALPHYEITLQEVEQCINWSRRRRELRRRDYPDYAVHRTFEASLLPPPWE